MSRVPPQLRAGIAAVLALAGLGGGYLLYDDTSQAMSRNAYIQAVALDQSTSPAVKVAMVMGSYYESSYKHIGTPYVDKLGKGQPWTVCNGITGPAVVPGRYYSQGDCYRLEVGIYKANERTLAQDAGGRWSAATVLQQASFIDFAHNLGVGAWQSSTMRRKLLAGDIVGACRENPKWVYGTVTGVKQVLPGLVVRRGANAELCEEGLT